MTGCWRWWPWKGCFILDRFRYSGLGLFVSRCRCCVVVDVGCFLGACLMFVCLFLFYGSFQIRRVWYIAAFRRCSADVVAAARGRFFRVLAFAAAVCSTLFFASRVAFLPSLSISLSSSPPSWVDLCYLGARAAFAASVAATTTFADVDADADVIVCSWDYLGHSPWRNVVKCRSRLRSRCLCR